MSTSNHFEHVVQDVRKQAHHYQNTQNYTQLQACVRAWCEHLKWQVDVNDAIKLYQESAHLKKIELRLTPDTYHQRPSNKELKNSNPSNKDKSKMEDIPYGYILFALAVAAAGYAAYHLKQKNPPNARKAPENALTSWTVVLVINADRENIIDTLRSGGAATLADDHLYKATQALWFGAEEDFETSTLAAWFSEDRAVTHTTEYDVHLIRFDLREDDPGLHRGASQLDRLDAFRRLRSSGLKAAVSPRLPSDAYGTTDTYSR